MQCKGRVTARSHRASRLRWLSQCSYSSESGACKTVACQQSTHSMQRANFGESKLCQRSYLACCVQIVKGQHMMEGAGVHLWVPLG